MMLITLAGPGLAAPSSAFQLHYAGRLTDASGSPLAGPVNLTVRFFRDPTGGAPLVVPLVKSGVTLADGVFDLTLDLPPADYHTVFNGSQPAYVEVEDTGAGRVYPRQTFGAVPYAQKVPVDGTTLRYNSDGELSAAGFVKPTGGYITTDADGNVTALHADSATTAASATTATTATTAGSFTGALAGDVTGNQGTTNVAKLQGSNVLIGDPAAITSGYVLKWNGSEWAPAPDTTSGAGVSEATTATNVGTGAGVFRGMSGYNLDFRKLNAGAGITVTQNANDITIASSVDQTTDFLSGSLTTRKQAAVTVDAYGAGAGQTGEIRFKDLGGTQYVALKGPDAPGGNRTFTLPGAYGAGGDVLKTDAAGNLSWLTLSATAPLNYSNGAFTISNATGAAAGAMSAADKTNLDAMVAKVSNWDASYTDRMKWDGGSSGLNAATGRTSLGLGNSATLDVGTSAGTVAAGNHTHANQANWDAAYTDTSNATSANTFSRLVKRDASGNFSAGTITASLTGNVTGNATNVTGVVAIANGGTGQTTASAALNALLPAQTAGTVLTTNGTAPSWLAYGTSGANKLLQLDAAGKLPALNGSLPTNVDAVSLQGTTVAAGTPSQYQVLTYNGSQWAATAPPHLGATCSLGSYITGFAADGTIICSSGDLGFTKVSAGQFHTCAILSDYTVRCWGNGANGRLGNKLTANSKKPVTVKLASGVLQNVIDLSVGFSHACAIVGNAAPGTQGSVWCWGLNSSGQLGDNTVTQRTYAVQVVGSITNAVQVSAGYAHTCVRLADNTAKCWGAGGSYRLGNGVATQSNIPVTVLQSAGTTATNIAYISAGWATTCIAKTDGSAYCVGNNSYYQLGDGTVTQQQYMKQPTGMTSGVTKIVTAMSYNASYVYAHTCAVKSGDLYCWGYNGHGQVGDGTAVTKTVPTLVALADTDDDGAVDDAFTSVTDVSVGGYHTCAIAAPNNAAYCWGYNADNAVTHTTTANQTRPVKVRNSDDSGPLENVISITTNMSQGAYTYSIAIVNDTGVASNGLGLAWGDNSQGQLGDETSTDTLTSPPVYVSQPGQ